MAGLADTFTGGLRLASQVPGGDFLGEGDSFEIHALYDLTSLPNVAGQSFGIRATDRAGPGTGEDVAQFSVIKSSVSGNIGIVFAELDFVASTSQTADFVSIQGVLGSATQVELVISKLAGSNLVGASFTVFDVGMGVLQSGILDAINNITLSPITLYNGVLFTRPQFYSIDTGVPIDTDVPIPEPGTLAILGLVGLGFARRKQAA